MSGNTRDEVTSAAILAAGKNVFQKWGLEKTTMEDIAREAGKGKSTLYYYYKKKEEIFDAVIRREIGDLLSRAKDSARDVSSARERLRKYVVSSTIEMKNSAPLYEILRREVEKDPNFFKEIQEHFQAGEVQFIQDILNLGVQQNHFSFANDQELAATAEVVLKILGCLQLGLLLDSHEIRHVELIARLVVNGI